MFFSLVRSDKSVEWHEGWYYYAKWNFITVY